MNRRSFLSSLMVAPLAIPAIPTAAAVDQRYAFIEGPLPDRPILVIFNIRNAATEAWLSESEQKRLVQQIIADNQEAVRRNYARFVAERAS